MRYGATIFLSFLTICSFGQPKDKYDKIVDSLSRAGQSDKLIPYFQKELKTQPKSETVLRWLGYLYLADNQLDLGEKYYRNALTINPKCARCYMHIAKVYAMKNDNQKALELFDKSISIDPNDAVLYATRAKLKEITGDKSSALIDLNKAIGLDPKNPEFYVQRGLYNASHDHVFFALSDMAKAIELAPDSYYPYSQRAGVYYGKQMLKEALEDMNTAIQLDSNRYSLYSDRAAIYAALKEQSKSMSDYTKAIKLNPKDFLSYYNRALDKFEMEDMDGACSDISECYTVLNKNEPNSPLKKELDDFVNNYCDSAKASYYYQRGIACYNLKQFDKAITIYTSGLRKFPNNSMTLSFRGNAYYALNDFKNALTDYYAAVQNKANVIADVKNSSRYKDAPADSVNLYVNGFLASMELYIAESKFALGQYDEALVEINKGIEIAPEIKEFGKENYYSVRGNILLALNKYGQAKNDFDKCIQLNPKFGFAYVDRAVAKINLASEIKMTSYSVRGGTDNRAFNANWTLPLKASVKKSDNNIILALADCDKAIEVESKLDYAYYVRGQIKKILLYADYCNDLLIAKKLGYPVDPEFLKDCGK